MRVIIQEYSGRTNKTLQSVPEGKQGWRGTTKLQGHLAQGLRDATPALQSPCWHHPWVQLPANTHPSRQQVVAQILESLPPPRRAWGMFPVLGFHLAHSWLPGHLRTEKAEGSCRDVYALDGWDWHPFPTLHTLISQIIWTKINWLFLFHCYIIFPSTLVLLWN